MVLDPLSRLCCDAIANIQTPSPDRSRRHRFMPVTPSPRSKSTSGGCQILGGKLVCWSAKKQSLVAMSSAQVEYVVVVGCCAKVLWIKSHFADYDVLYDKVPIFCDNTSVIAISNNPVLHSRIKHIDISNVLFSDLVVKLTTGKNGREGNRISAIQDISLSSLNICWEVPTRMTNSRLLSPTRYQPLLSKTPFASEVPLTSHMMKVAKLLPEPQETLILLSQEVNADNTTDKSFSGTFMQPVSQPKAPTDKNIEESVTTGDATKSVDASESTEELRNQPKPIDAEEIIRVSTSILKYSVHSESAPRNDTLMFIMPDVNHENSRLCKYMKQFVEEAVKYSRITSMGNITFEELYGMILIWVLMRALLTLSQRLSHYTNIGSSIDQEMQEADSDLESMPDDAILFVSGFEEADVDESRNVEELLAADKAAADNVTGEYVDMENTRDANLNVFAAKETNSDPLGHLQADITSLTAKVNHLDYSKTLSRNSCPSLTRESNRHSKPKFPTLFSNHRTKSLMLSTNWKVEAEEVPTNAQGEQMSSALVIYSSDEEPPAKKFKVVLEEYLVPSPTPLNSIRLTVIDNIPYEKFTANLFSSGSFEFSPTPSPKVSDKGKGIAQTSKDDQLTAEEGLLTLEEAKLQIKYGVNKSTLSALKKLLKKRSKKMIEEYNHCITFIDGPHRITKFSYRVNNSTKKATMRIKRNNQPLNLTVYDKFMLKKLTFTEWLELHDLATKVKIKSNDQLLKNLKAKFHWVATQAGKLGIPILPELTEFELPLVSKKRKRTAEIIKEGMSKMTLWLMGCIVTWFLLQGLLGNLG
ncbi:hypothetical protein Tco_1354418 [Tanacetum coccineum]